LRHRLVHPVRRRRRLRHAETRHRARGAAPRTALRQALSRLPQEGAPLDLTPAQPAIRESRCPTAKSSGIDSASAAAIAGPAKAKTGQDTQPSAKAVESSAALDGRTRTSAVAVPGM